MTWPRGKYNGLRIVGIRIEIRVDVTSWNLIWGNTLFGRCWALGPVRVWLGWEYQWPR